ncbi:hypothetical protein ACT009_06920 [Sphingomonas sp. Tas61C01]|uniref:hypothetical protein n=1 Tax=Sphingomonas sp. Tas61C01 TaxID=3458297 RepID=UPI00403EC784
MLFAVSLALPAPAETMRCTAPLPADMASWATPVALENDTMLPIGRAARATLSADAKLAVAPEKLPAAGSFGGTLRFRIVRQGRYKVALDGPAWIDVLNGGARLASVAHKHGEQCSSIRKTVEFVLTPGSYALQLSGAARASVTVFVGPAK